MPDANLEIQVRNASNSKLSIVTSGNGSVMDRDESGGDECDSCDEQPIPLKKSRVKNGGSKDGHGVGIGHNKNSSIMSALSMCGSNSRDRDRDISDQDECSGSGPSIKEGNNSASFTSGENSDADGGADGEEHINGVNLRQDNPRSFECDVCNMKFSNGANMRRHRMRHTGVKPYECKMCQKRFFRKDHLAEHMATHSKMLPFKCPICNKGFQRQIAMRAHFQNEHVGNQNEQVKACPLCTYKGGSMKSLRVHFRSRHGIDLDNPIPNSASIQSSGNGRSSGSPPNNSNGEYSELAHALNVFDDREKSNDSLIPSHFLVPQIEISSNSSYPTHFTFTADSSYNGHRSSSSPPHVSPASDSSPSSSDLVVVKKEVLSLEDRLVDQSSCFNNGDAKSKDSSDNGDDDMQEMPEDLSFGNASMSKCCSTTPSKLSPLKTLLREDWNNSKDSSHANSSASTSRSRSDSYHAQSYEGDDISSSIGLDSSGHSAYSTSRRGATSAFPAGFPANYMKNFCHHCHILFPDKTLYFLHKGCHSQRNPWRCNICNEETKNVFDFNSHLLSKSHN